MITEFKLENFKAFAQVQSAQIKPITLIYGANSSGKSSIIQALLMLKQTLEEQGNETDSLLPKGSLIDLGSFREFVNVHDTSREVAFYFAFKDSQDSSQSITDLCLQNIRHLRSLSDFGSIGEPTFISNISDLEIGLKIYFSRAKGKSGIILSKIDIFFASREPLAVLANQEGKFTFKEINSRHDLIREIRDNNRENLDEYVRQELNLALKNLGYGEITQQMFRRKNSVGSILKKNIDGAKKDLAAEAISTQPLKEKEDVLKKQVDALQSQKISLEQDIKKLEEDIKNIDETDARTKAIDRLNAKLRNRERQT
jgi:AAA15 family ATPase/GTPase